MFDRLPSSPEDALHAVIGRFNADTRAHKIDLGVGVYRDDTGASPIMACVDLAQQRLAQEEQTKSYLALRGDERFLEEMTRLVFERTDTPEIAAVQTVGGTGGVRLGIELAKNAKPDARVFVGVPTWPNHLGICEQLGAECITWPYFDVDSQKVDVEATYAALAQAEAGDVIILHGPCHNPTGADLPADTLLDLCKVAGEKGVIPLIDAAYYGLGNALDDDLGLLRRCVASAPETLLVLSCSKAFGLYRERAGALFVGCASLAAANKAQARLEFIARGAYSMPPSHGAAVAGLVLADGALASQWRQELEAMRLRLRGVRESLLSANSQASLLAHVGDQLGIFSLLALSAERVTRLAEEHAIYLPASGRINLAGFKSGDVPLFVEALLATAETG